MKAFRLATLIAVPATLLLSACAGGSSGIIGGGGGIPGQQANVRFVNGEPGATSYDIYFQSTGSSAPSSPLISALTYGTASDFKPLPTVAGNVIVHTAGSPAPSTGAPALASCPVPQFSDNTNYSIVIATAAGSAPNCIIFSDANYTGSGNQYRFHDASSNANAAIGMTVAQGTATAPGAPGITFAVLGTTQAGPAAVSNASYLVIAPTTMPTTATVSFAVGQYTNGVTTESASNTLDASALMLPGSTAQPNSGTTNFTLPSGYAGASIYAIDCGTGTLPPGSHCVSGVALIGVFDTH